MVSPAFSSHSSGRENGVETPLTRENVLCLECGSSPGRLKMDSPRRFDGSGLAKLDRWRDRNCGFFTLPLSPTLATVMEFCSSSRRADHFPNFALGDPIGRFFGDAKVLLDGTPGNVVLEATRAGTLHFPWLERGAAGSHEKRVPLQSSEGAGFFLLWLSIGSLVTAP